ncbi:transaldolase family protein [Streptomyces nitrosporeus]|uniref:transaldolase family protein n=1 Tax=Streptomyces nitrosporeus TaxID=28894 RepID=UPI003325357E
MDEAETARSGSALSDLAHEGVSVWLDEVTRRTLTDGTLSRLVSNASVTGALLPLRELGREVREGTAYRGQIGALGERGAGAEEVLRALHRQDARRACDMLAARFASTHGADGWVCAELDPRSADDVRGSLAEARGLVRAVDRPNLLITVPATAAGLQVVSGCLAEGIGVNISHLYAPRAYEEAADACFEGLERALAAGRPPVRGSVASFGAVRMETALRERQGRTVPHGRFALALARVVYHLYEERLGTSHWRRLRSAGAGQQRLLWSGAAEADGATAVRRAEDLVAWNTVQAMPARTVDAVARQGRLRGDTLSGESAAARRDLSELRAGGVDIEELAGEVASAELRGRAEERAALAGSLWELAAGAGG